MSALISTDELAARLGNPRLRVVDASWHMPAEKRDARAEYENAHIPGAVFFDIDANSDKHSPYPHMLPDADAFAKEAGALGLGNDSEIVVYDTHGIFSAARVWWMLRVFGHENVRVLDGGLLKWKAENRKVDSAKAVIMPATFRAKLRGELVKSFDEMQATQAQVADARSPARFSGSEPEPRPGLASGHIPGSANVYFRDCLTDGSLKPADELRALFAARGIDPTKPVIATCGSGVTACILTLALYEMGNTQAAVYDGSWAEWGSRKSA